MKTKSTYQVTVVYSENPLSTYQQTLNKMTLLYTSETTSSQWLACFKKGELKWVTLNGNKVTGKTKIIEDFFREKFRDDFQAEEDEKYTTLKTIS